MTGRILFVAFAEPEPVGSNRTAALTVSGLRGLGYDIEMLTSHRDLAWRGPRPTAGSDTLAGIPHLGVERAGGAVHMVAPPESWCVRVPNEAEWEAAVAWGVKALLEIGPALVHVQQWQYLGWMMESAQRLGIPVVHSINDYGLACARTVLVDGWDKLCDGATGVEKCSRCIVAGRNLLGKANELVAALPLGESMLTAAYRTRVGERLARREAVRIPVRRRVTLSLERCRSMLENLCMLITPNPFAADFFRQFGVPPERIRVLPWFHDQQRVAGPLPADRDTIRIALVTRISPEKGVDVLLEALRLVEAARPVEVRVVGAQDSDYAQSLQRRFPGAIGRNRVVWQGWVPNNELLDVYNDAHLAAIPSVCYDNTPLTLVEALAHGRPVLCTDVPTMTHLVRDHVNGRIFPMGDVAALAKIIEELANTPSVIYELAKRTRNVPTLSEYVEQLDEIYQSILC